MESKNIVIIAATVVIIILIIFGIYAYGNNAKDGVDPADIFNMVNSSEQANNTTNTSHNVTANTTSGDSDIVSEEIVYNEQAGGGYYREVHYRDGGFRQYDVETGKLIGSSYQSDQQYLPSMD